MFLRFVDPALQIKSNETVRRILCWMNDATRVCGSVYLGGSIIFFGHESIIFLGEERDVCVCFVYVLCFVVMIVYV